MVDRGKSEFDVEVAAEVSEFNAIELFSIVHYYVGWYPELTYDSLRDKVSHLILRIKWDAKSYVRPEISHTHKPTNYE